jgi:AcrR family transcriptional regulator
MTPRSDVSAERRAQIIKAAMTCFMRKGYSNTSMDDIVAESGLSKGSLYWYFKSKDDLFESAVKSFFADFGQESLAGFERCTTASDKLRFLGKEMTGFVKMAEGLFNLFLEFWAQSSSREEAGRLWTDLLVQYKAIVVDIIEEGVRKCEFKPVNAEGLVWAMMAAYDGLAAYTMLMPALNMEQVSQAFIETLLKGLEADDCG